MQKTNVVINNVRYFHKTNVGWLPITGSEILSKGPKRSFWIQFPMNAKNRRRKQRRGILLYSTNLFATNHS